MSTVVKSQSGDLIVDGATIRVGVSANSCNSAFQTHKYKPGLVHILPKVQIILGDELESFKSALNASRLPIALRKTLSQGLYETWEVLHLPAGKIPEAGIATIQVFNSIIVGVTYSRGVLKNKEFTRLVRLSAMHKICICHKGDKSRAFKATQCIERLTGVHRDKLIVSETKRSIRVRVNYKSKISLPVYYTFVLDDTDRYNLLQIAFDLNDVGQRLS